MALQASAYDGKLALVSGGASGIGKACVERFTKLGARVIIADLPTSNGEKIAENISNHMAEFIPVDIGNEEQVEELFERIKSKYHRLDILVNSAGIQRFPYPVYNFTTNQPHSMEVFNKVIQVNLAGTFNMIRLAVGLMNMNSPSDADGERGVIVNIASSAPLNGAPWMTAYNASKAGIIGMTLPMSRELGQRGIRVVTLAPGTVDTPLLASTSPAEKEILAASPFPKRYAATDEVAHLVQSVVDNHMINGDVIRIDGGFRHPFSS